jgi:hypothetical protein
MFACRPEPSRYLFETNVTKRVDLYPQSDEPKLTGALVLLGPNISVRICRRMSLGFDFVSNWRSSSPCGNRKGPIQVIVPKGYQTLHLSSWNKFGEATSDYALGYNFENGVIYEIFFEEHENVVDWQLYSVSQHRFDILHKSAPAELQRLPISPETAQ